MLSGRLSFEGSARAELEQQLAVAVNEAQSQAAQAVGRQRRAAARATAAEKALFARDELRQLAEAVAERQACTPGTPPHLFGFCAHQDFGFDSVSSMEKKEERSFVLGGERNG